MPVVILICSTILIGFWQTLLWRAVQDDWVSAAYAKYYDNLNILNELRIKAKHKEDALSMYSGMLYRIMDLIRGGDITGKIEELERGNKSLQNGDLRSLSVFIIPGYVLQREFDAIGRGNIHRVIMEKSIELYGKKHAPYKTKQLLAGMLSYPLIGIAVTLALGVMLLGAGLTTAGTAVIIIGIVLVFVLVYAMYDELDDRVKKRRSAISRQFPNVVSKLALLVTSGMIMDRAWNETAQSRDSELYREMRKVSEELNNLVSPESAYGNFIYRCNTKETAKLASAILQNMSKGNAEIGRLLKELAREAWQERRHMAKRDAEKANSKLMIPTMLLFLAILVMLMVPIAMNFSSL